MNQTSKPKNVTSTRRVIALDAHPDTFTVALLHGQTPAQAQVEKLCNKVPMSQLLSWARKNTTESDLFVLEASGNSFKIVRLLASIGRKAVVLESCQMGKLKEAHANNDKISAVRIGKAYLAGTAKEVWVPDERTQARRDLFHIHRKSVKRTTQMRNRILSYLSDNDVRLADSDEVLDLARIEQCAAWLPHQKRILAGLHLELTHAQEQRQHWESLIAQEVLGDPQLLSLIRLCGIRDIVSFSLGAIIGSIDRFKHPKKLVKYIGLNPAFDDSGEGEWRGGIGGHGRKDLRSLLMESAQALLRSDHPIGKWGRKLLARKGNRNIAVAAVARKLTVAIWYLLKGHWTPLQEIDKALSLKVGKVITRMGRAALTEQGKTRQIYRKEIFQTLKAVHLYQLDPHKKMPAESSSDKKSKELVK